MRTIHGAGRTPRTAVGSSGRVRRMLMSVLLGTVILGALLASPAGSCRFWGLVGSSCPSYLVTDHLRDGSIENLKNLGGMNRDGWGFAYYPSMPRPLFNGPIARRGGAPANHPHDPEYDLAVDEMSLMRPKAALGHVRAGTSGHWGIPNPHPFEHEGMVFAHNGTISTATLVMLLTEDDPGYFDTHPTDYVNGYIDSELYFLCLLKFMRQRSDLPRAEALREAVRRVVAVAQSSRLNFVLTDGDTLFVLRWSPYDAGDAVRYTPATGAASSYWIAASQVLGSSAAGWGTLPERSLAVFVPGHRPRFLRIDMIAPTETEEARAEIGAASPNPMDGEIGIPIVVPDGGAPVGIEVYDVQGRLVWKEGIESLAPGPAVVRWDGCDTRGDPVPRGVYFCRIVVGDRTSERTITVLRR